MFSIAAFDIDDGAVNGPPFCALRAVIETTEPRVPVASHRLPQPRVTMKVPLNTMFEIASNPRIERSSVRLMKLPAALLTRPVSGPSDQIASSIAAIESHDRISHGIVVTVPPGEEEADTASLIAEAASSSTPARRPQITTCAPSAAQPLAIIRPIPLPPPVTSMRSFDSSPGLSMRSSAVSGVNMAMALQLREPVPQLYGIAK